MQQVLYLADHAVRYDTKAFLDAVCDTAAQSFADSVHIDTAADPATAATTSAVIVAAATARIRIVERQPRTNMM